MRKRLACGHTLFLVLVALMGPAFLEAPRAEAATPEMWGIPLYPGASLKGRTKDGNWDVAQYQAKERASKVIDFYSIRYGEPTLDGGKWRFDGVDPDLELEVAEITLGPDAGRTIVFLRHKTGAGSKSSEKVAPESAASQGAIWGIPVYPGAVRRGLMEAGTKKFVTFSTPADPRRVIEFYSPKFGKARDLPPNRKLIKAAREAVEITIAPTSGEGAEITYTSTKPLEE